MLPVGIVEDAPERPSVRRDYLAVLAERQTSRVGDLDICIAQEFVDAPFLPLFTDEHREAMERVASPVRLGRSCARQVAF